MVRNSLFFLVIYLFRIAGFASNLYEVKIELMQADQITRSLIMEYSSSNCQIKFQGKNKKVKNKICGDLVKKYQHVLEKKNSFFADLGRHSTFYIITFQYGGKKWVSKTEVSDHQLCDSKNRCENVGGSDLRKFVSEVNGLIN